MTLTQRELDLIQAALRHGAGEASDALGRWIGRSTRIAFDAFEQLPLDEATGVLGAGDEPVCFCRAEMTGSFGGHLILAFDDASGLALADLLLAQPAGTATDWDEMERSAALETTNIVCCAYLNALARTLPATPGSHEALMPSPPRFARDFPESLLEFALMEQIIASDQVLIARTEFRIDDSPVDWTLLYVPETATLEALPIDAP